MANPLAMLKSALDTVGASKPIQGVKEVGNAIKKPIMKGYSTVKKDIKDIKTSLSDPTPIPEDAPEILKGEAKRRAKKMLAGGV